MPELPNANPHYDRAKSRLHNGTTNEVARAQAEATLALVAEQNNAAYEAETANLINYLAVASQHRLAYQPGEGVLKSIQARVEERLGLA